jgi:transcriptional regulator GlxA family with amidase domain
VHGLVDLFGMANRLKGGPGPELEVQVLRTEEPLPGDGDAWTAVILPPSLGGGDPAKPDAPLVRWLRRRHRQGTLLCSVCAGAFTLAETGLLAGRTATTHWALREAFAARFPEVLLDTDRMIVDEGDLITAGGLMAWVDLGLRLIERYLGPTVMLATARFFLVDPGGREQRFYSPFVPVLTHGDRAVLKVQRWLQARGGERVSLEGMAGKAGLGERTFLRRFQKATGLTPIAYVQHLRVGRARELLEASDRSIDEVAWQVGYEDTGAFRKVFLRVMGLTPGEYRRRFSHVR